MAQRLRTDWVLFGTIVVMVCFGLVMIYSASSVVAQLNPRIKSSFYYAAHQLVWAALSFGALMYFKRRDYRALQSPGWAFGSLGVVLFLQILVFFFDQQNASLVSPGRHRHAAAIRVCQTGAGNFLRLFRHRETRRHQFQTHHAGGFTRFSGHRSRRWVRRPGDGAGVDHPRRDRLLCCGLAAQVRGRGSSHGAGILDRFRGVKALSHGAHDRIFRSRNTN